MEMLGIKRSEHGGWDVSIRNAMPHFSPCHEHGQRVTMDITVGKDIVHIHLNAGELQTHRTIRRFPAKVSPATRAETKIPRPILGGGFFHTDVPGGGPARAFRASSRV